MKKSKYQSYIETVCDGKLPEFINEHSKAIRHVYSRIGNFTQQDVDTRIQLAFSPDQPSEIKSMTAFEILCWYKVFNCYAQGNYFLDTAPLYVICDKDNSSKYMLAVYVNKEPCEKTYKELSTKHPQSAKAYLDYCKFATALNKKNLNLDVLYGGEELYA
jgi:hypothetical protein